MDEKSYFCRVFRWSLSNLLVNCCIDFLGPKVISFSGISLVTVELSSLTGPLFWDRWHGFCRPRFQSWISFSQPDLKGSTCCRSNSKWDHSTWSVSYSRTFWIGARYHLQHSLALCLFCTAFCFSWKSSLPQPTWILRDPWIWLF